MNTEQILSERLTAFWREMYEWEVVAYEEGRDSQLFSDSLWKEKQTAIRTKIYEEYITQRERKYGGAKLTSIGFPPEYDPEQESIKSMVIDKKKASVFTDKIRIGISYQREYKFKFVGGKWLIDVIKQFDEFDQKWCSVIIL